MTVFRLCRIALLLLLIGLSGGCATVSFDQPKSHSIAFTDTGDTVLGKLVADWVALHQGLSGFYPLEGGMDALGVRLRLAERAERSI
ncbi:MAG: phospholipase D family protein, partial [Desulfobulbaceae bacterium]|nr:phospholipase D family protein [Desulfobulbaceae bacterium]